MFEKLPNAENAMLEKDVTELLNNNNRDEVLDLSNGRTETGNQSLSFLFKAPCFFKEINLSNTELTSDFCNSLFTRQLYVEKLVLNNIKVSDANFLLICKFIENNKIKILYLNELQINSRHISVSNGLLSLAEAVRANQELVELFLAKNFIGNDIKVILDAITNKPKGIEVLNISYNQINNPDIFKNVFEADKIEQLYLDYNNLGKNDFSEFSYALFNTQNLKTLGLNRNLIKTDHCNKLFSKLGSSKIQNLYLSQNCIERGAGNAIGEMIAESQSLTCIDLSYNFIGEGVGDIAAHLPENTSLQTLNLSYCNINLDDFYKLLDGVSQSNIIKLNLTGNIFSEKKYLNFQPSSIKIGNLRELILASCNLKPVILRHLLKSIHSTHLIIVDLSNSSFLKKDWLALNSFLKTNPTVKLLTLKDIVLGAMKSNPGEKEAIFQDITHKRVGYFKTFLEKWPDVNIIFSPDLVGKIRTDYNCHQFIYNKRLAFYQALSIARTLIYAIDNSNLNKTNINSLPLDVKLLLLENIFYPYLNNKDVKKVVEYVRTKHKEALALNPTTIKEFTDPHNVPATLCQPTNVNTTSLSRSSENNSLCTSTPTFFRSLSKQKYAFLDTVNATNQSLRSQYLSEECGYRVS